MNPLVAQKIDDFTAVLNQGSAHGLRLGHRFLVYGLGPTITDPETGAPLGTLEVVRGTGTITHLQESICTIKSDMKNQSVRVIKKQNSMGGIAAIIGYSDVEEVSSPEPKPFDGIQRGDRARLV